VVAVACKKRLTLELGRISKRENWSVFKVKEWCKVESLNRLAERFTDKTPVLLLFDYLENNESFESVVGFLAELNERGHHQWRWVANCRSSHFRHLEHLENYQRVDLSPQPSNPYYSWFDGYRKGIIRYILKKSQLEAHKEKCRNKPIYAVFLHYLF